MTGAEETPVEGEQPAAGSEEGFALENGSTAWLEEPIAGETPGEIEASQKGQEVEETQVSCRGRRCDCRGGEAIRSAKRDGYFNL